MDVDPELTKRFRADLASLWPEVGESDAKLGIALSGGPDSLALLLLAHNALRGRVEAATVDHGLRSESTAEAEHAARICAVLGVAHETLAVEVARGNLQSEARSARYAALADWAERQGVDALCTAHHRDDQVETLLMRLNRGSGLSGLAGVRPAGLVPGSDIKLLRPLLGWDRGLLGGIVDKSDFEAVQDPSNEDRHFDRVRMRKALAGADWIDPAGVARSAQVLAAMEESVLGLVAEDLQLFGEVDGERATYRPFAQSGVHRPPLWGEVIVMIYAELGRTISRSDAVSMAESLIDGQPINIGGIHATPGEQAGEKIWTFAPENPRRAG